MKEVNAIGLDQTAVDPVVAKLEQLLSDYHLFYANLRGLHWNIRGDKFFELHELYEEYYNEVAEQIDNIAERLVQLGATPASSLSQHLKQSEIKELNNVSNWLEGVQNVKATLEFLLAKHRELIPLALKANDAGTLSLASHAVKNYEKKLWMLSAYLAD
ncbi:MAG: DNA starvation/stationary phase protection protein [Prevotellaceae bacterium]|jgi:starvation-inducible DNA-binding protein|nr:DNA starvation/stationary phase protection protein [Prevotellaceae bacterium]